MFTGLVANIGEVVSYSGDKLKIKANIDCKLGDSIAINGVCLTVVHIWGDMFVVDVSQQTQKTVAANNFKNKVHIEQAMRLSDRLDGHIVQGHIDCIGVVRQITKQQNQITLKISLDEKFMKFVIDKGSIAIDGISLTISRVDVANSAFELTIIPHTWDNTIFQYYKIGHKVNIETDMFARYIFNMINQKEKDALKWDNIDKIMARY